MDSLKIIANAHVITCDPNNRAGRYNLLIRDNRIVEISDKLDLFTSLYPYATVIDASNKLIIPGFVNAHFHSESVLLRARTDDLHCSLWKTDLRTQECIKALIDSLNHDDVRNVYLMSYFSHLKSGTTCVGEFGLPFGDVNFNQMLLAMERTEVKNVVALQNWDQIVRAREVRAGRHRFLVNIGKAEEFTVYGFENLTRAAKELAVPLIAHTGEQRREVEFIRGTFHRTILSVLQDYNVVSPETVFVHLNHLSAQETEALSESDASAVLCARSAAFKRTGYPSLRHLANQRIRFAVGTDWGNVDILEELKFLHQLHFLISGIPPFTPPQLVRMGTINGAHALGLSHETGSIEVGKKADLTFYSLNDMRLPVIPEFADTESLSSLLINHITSRDVSEVMIDGEFYLTNGEVMTMAEEEIVQGFRSTYSKFYGDDANKIIPSRTSELAGADQRPAPKILPFTHAGRASQPPEEGFESGFHVTEEPAPLFEVKSRIMSTQSSPKEEPPKEDTPLPKREQSKETWLTFGEDEEF
ncbi:MAG: Amidohydro-rel protein [Bacteroidetes bacterium]|nr:Amidohydro-rel protein [Bacteroidota bacterium]